MRSSGKSIEAAAPGETAQPASGLEYQLAVYNDGSDVEFHSLTQSEYEALSSELQRLRA